MLDNDYLLLPMLMLMLMPSVLLRLRRGSDNYSDRTNWGGHRDATRKHKYMQMKCCADWPLGAMHQAMKRYTLNITKFACFLSSGADEGWLHLNLPQVLAY